MTTTSSYEASVLAFRSDPAMADFVEKNYFDVDLEVAATRYGDSPEFKRAWAALLPALAVGGRVLDLGSGRGLTSIALSRQGARVTSLEYDPSEVVGTGALSKFLRTHTLPVELVRGDILSLPFPDHSFNAAFCRSCLHHLSDLGQGLRDICRVLKPGGLFLACNEHIVSLFSSGDRFRDAHPAVRCGVEERAYSTFHYRHALSKAGFGRIRVFGFPPSYEEFLELTRQNPMRARLVSLPIAGGALSRLLYAVHVVVRRHLRVPEEFLPAITLLARKAV